MRIVIINGPNLNLLGKREPSIYGIRSMEQVLVDIQRAHPNVYLEYHQSNHEGDIIDKIHEAYQKFDGIVINPAAYTHTSVAILDALKAVGIPTVEVHLSDINEREEFRKFSYVSMVAEKTICGEGFEGYRKALEYFCK